MSARLVVISGCSGGGKSTLLDALQARGCDVVPEVGRRLVREELARGGQALPWTDPTAFLHRMVTMTLAAVPGARAKRADLSAAGRRAAGRQRAAGLPGADVLAGVTDPPFVHDPRFFVRMRLPDGRATAGADLDAAACHTGVIFFDRSLIDALSGLEHRTGEPVLATLGQTHRYHRQVFFAPSWPEIYVMDAERRHDFAAAQAEERRLRRDYRAQAIP